MANSNNYLRQVGIPEEKFTLLPSKLQQEIDRDLVENKMKKRGIQSKIMTTGIASY